MSWSVDLNADLGEGAGHDDELLGLVSSANIACGRHAGSAEMMRRSIASAQERGVAVGAHPGFADPENFGRRELKLSTAEIFALVSGTGGGISSGGGVVRRDSAACEAAWGAL